MSNVSDFKLPTAIIRDLCRIKQCSFVDLPILIDDEENVDKVENNTLYIGNPINLGHLLFKIVNTYINSSEHILEIDIADKEKEDFLVSAALLIRSVVYTNDNDAIKDINIHHLYQRPLVWLIMKNIICPIKKIPVKNIKIMFGCTPYSDISRFYDPDEIDTKFDINESFIFVNEYAENKAVQNACLLIETIKAHDLDAHSVIKEVFDSLYSHFYGVLKLAFEDDDKVDEFIGTLSFILDIPPNDVIVADNKNLIDKTAQTWDSPGKLLPMMWWYLGLYEKMLEPARGADWSTYENLQGYNEDLWNQIEAIKSERPHGETTVPFNEMLKIKREHTTELGEKPKTIAEDLLSSQRIWQ